MGYIGDAVVKNLPVNAIRGNRPGSSHLTPGMERSPGGGNGSPIYDSCLESPRREESGRLQSTASQRLGHK